MLAQTLFIIAMIAIAVIAASLIGKRRERTRGMPLAV